MQKSSFKPLKYKCPVCGKRAVFGTHHCEVKPAAEAEESAPAPVSGLKYALSVLVALVLITAFLWEMIGIYSLLAWVVLPLCFLFFRIARRLPSSPHGDYRSLLRMANHDKEAVERLIAMEAIKHPGKPRKDLIKNLLVQWRRDLR